MRTKPFAALLLAASALAGTARADAVLMLDHTPSVEELRSYLAPEPARRTRGIEIVGQSPAQPVPATPASAAAPMPAADPAPAAPAPTTIGVHIPFAYDSAELLPEGRPFLDQLGQVLQAEPNLVLVVEGHTDAHGGESYNKALSQRRAKAVQGYLSQMWHVPAQRLSIIGKGKAEPLTADPFDARNRRVQFRPVG